MDREAIARFFWRSGLILLAFPLIQASGCAAGAAGVVLAILSASGGGGAGETNSVPSTPVVEPPARLNGDLVKVRYFILDDTGGPLDVSIEWQPADGSLGYREASEFQGEFRGPDGKVIVSEGTGGLMTEPNKPRETFFIWNARQDLRSSNPGMSMALVRMRITTLEKKIGASIAGITEPFIAGNEPPAISALKQLGGSGTISFEVDISDSTSDPVKLTATFRIGETGEKRPMTLIAPPADVLLDTLPGEGKSNLVAWESQNPNDMKGLASEEVFFEVIPNDLYDPGSGIGLTIRGTVDNNSDPVMEIFDIESSLDRSFEIPLRFSVRDEESHRVDVVLQWSLQSEPFPELPPDLDFLRRLLGGDIGETLTWDGRSRPVSEWRRELHVLSEAPLYAEGTVSHSEDPAPGRFCATDLVRQGLVFRPPDENGTRSFPDGPLGKDSEVFLIGREIRFENDPGWRRIDGFDPGTSIVTLAEPVGPPPAGTQYSLELNQGVKGLKSSPEGVIYTFLWDSLKDMSDTETASDSTIQLRALGIDSQAGQPSSNRIFKLGSSSLSTSSTIATRSIGSQSIAVGDINGDGKSDIVLVNSIFAELILFFRRESGEFIPNGDRTILTQEDPTAVVVGDVDGDGGKDIVVAKGDHTLSIYFQDEVSPGLFTAPLDLVTGNEPVSLAIGDVDGDGRNDVVVANHSSNTLSVFLQGADRFFQARTFSTGKGPHAVSIGDVDGDGLDDVVVACWTHNVKGEVDVFIQSKDGLELSRSFSIDRPSSAVGDINGDGRNDIVVTDEESDRAIVYFQSLEGNFSETPSLVLQTDVKPTFVAIGDVNHDRRNDVIILNSISGSLSVFLQTREGLLGQSQGGLFIPTQTLATGKDPGSLAIGDVNEDGLEDVLVANYSSGFVSVFLQSFAGNIPTVPVQTLKTQARPSFGRSVSVALGELDGDGQTDIVVVNNSIGSIGIYYQGLAGGYLETSVDLETDAAPISAAIGDVDGDGRNDIAVANESSDTVTVYLQSNLGTFKKAPSLRLTAGRSPSMVAVGDVDGDGRNDVLVANRLSDPEGRYTVSVFLQGSTGSLPAGASRILIAGKAAGAASLGPSSLAVGDLDGDGREDLAVANESLGTVSLFLGTSSGDLVQGQVISLGPGTKPIWVAIGDVNDDGRNDLVVTNGGANYAVIYYQKEEGAFSLSPDKTLLLKSNPRMAIIGDVNGDGKNDIIAITYLDKLEFFFQSPMNPGEIGSCTEDNCYSSQNFILPSGPAGMAIGDLNRDGRLDLVVGFIKLLEIYIAQ